MAPNQMKYHQTWSVVNGKWLSETLVKYRTKDKTAWSTYKL